ncbi:MAG TPA: methyltransferase [Oligoflexus sp.]|uniref:methyltransferase n=1 Tax=Oligoflexus sp. TaxID=1971216 RepID=UPI002D7FE084|nr:methyltransferase [Oligoflexus sp.]HET9240282.1 methyltransferase [Oligoflexus sp.]
MLNTHLSAHERYDKLARLLRPWSLCWGQSVLHHWPSCRDALPEDWWQGLMSWSLADMHRLDDAIAGAQLIPDNLILPPGLQRFMEALQPLLAFPQFSDAERMSEKKNLHMTAKKQHEIGALLPFLKRQKEALGIERAVDIGGGVGHLARTLVTTLDIPMVTIDRDEALQKEGRSLLHKLKLKDIPLEFVAGTMEPGPQHELDPHFQGACLSLGLHTCGPLAWTHLKKSQASRAVLNFGCCYDRMDVERDCQQSAWARKHPVPLTSFALFLATRGRRRSLQELAMQEKVNTYRLALHLFLQEEGHADGFRAVGDASRATYDLGFTAYAADRFRFLGLDCSSHRAQAFISRPDVQRSMREFFVINVVRNVFARPLEVILLLDRVLWMEEQGHAVELLAFFDHSLSPRNLGLFAEIKNSSASQPS